MTPLLSVVIPVFNGAAFVGAAIESVLGQAFHDWELIVVDDGSTDDTAAVVSRFTDPRIRCIHQHNQGLSTARNKGIGATTGEWLGFLDADDLWLPAFGSRMLEAALAAPDAGVICCGWQYIDVAGRPQGPARTPSPNSLPIGQLLKRNAFPVMAAIVRRRCLETIGLFDLNMPAVGDWDLWLRLALAGYRFVCLQDILAAYRQTPGSMSRDASLMLRNGLAVLEKVFSRPDLAPEVRALQQVSYGLCRLAAEAQCFDVGREEEWLRRLALVLSEYPVLFQEMDTYYAIMCAGQEMALLGTGEGLDLTAAADRFRRVLKEVEMPVRTDSVPVSSLAHKLGSLALAELALQKGDRRMALTCAARSVVFPGNRWARNRSVRLLLKTLAGPRLHGMVTRRVRRVSAPSMPRDLGSRPANT